MRPTSMLLALLALVSAAPSAAQGIVLPVRCAGACTLSLDSVDVWANLDTARAITYVDHVIRNATADSVEGAFFFPIPRGAVVDRVWVRSGQQLELYGEWTRPEESRSILAGLARTRPNVRLPRYAGMDVIHVRVPAIAPHGVKHLQIGYTQPLRAARGRISYRYPLALAAASSGHLDLGMTVKTAAGFQELRSPTHAVRTELGTEPGPCAPQERCGTKGYPSHRIRIVRMEHAADAWSRDFELVYIPNRP